jgi:hypothetical protein
MHRVEDLPNWFRAKACSGDVHSKPAPPLRGTLIRHASVVPRECPREESGAASSSSRATRRPPVVRDQASSELARSCRDLPPAGRTGSAGVSTFGSSAECPPVGPGRSRAPSGLECGPTLARRCPCRFRPAPCHRRCRRKREIGAGPSGAGVPDPPRPRPSWGAVTRVRSSWHRSAATSLGPSSAVGECGARNSRAPGNAAAWLTRNAGSPDSKSASVEDRHYDRSVGQGVPRSRLPCTYAGLAVGKGPTEGVTRAQPSPLRCRKRAAGRR